MAFKALVFNTRAAALLARNRINNRLGYPHCDCPKCNGGADFPECPCIPPAVNITCRYATFRWGRIVRHPTLARYAIKINQRFRDAAAAEGLTGLPAEQDVDAETWAGFGADTTADDA